MNWKKLSGCVLLIIMTGVLPLQAQDTLEDIVNDFVGAADAAVVVQITTPEDSWTAVGGLADGERLTVAEDRFRIGSMSKTFVATAALMLAEEGLIDLDDLARDWLPDEVVGQIENADLVTIRQLLAMRSGIADYLETEAFWEAVYNDPFHEWTVREALEYADDLPSLFAPDERFSYSNTNYLLVQLILEEASGMPLHTLLRDRIIDPLKLRDTYTQVSETLPDGFVHGYTSNEDGERDDVTDLNDGAGLGDGGLVSNAADLTTFYRALLQDQTLLSADAMEELLSFEEAGDDQYSLGLNRWQTPVGEALGHAGGVTGFLTLGVYLPEYEAIIIVLSASDSVQPEELALAAAQAVLD